MNQNAFVSIGDTLIFNDIGGYCGGGDFVVNTPYTIKAMNIPYRTEGFCDVELCTGATVRLSEVHDNRTHGGYTNYFVVVKSDSYEIY